MSMLVLVCQIEMTCAELIEASKCYKKVEILCNIQNQNRYGPIKETQNSVK
jgi:hypothetical protein